MPAGFLLPEFGEQVVGDPGELENCAAFYAASLRDAGTLSVCGVTVMLCRTCARVMPVRLKPSLTEHRANLPSVTLVEVDGSIIHPSFEVRT